MQRGEHGVEPTAPASKSVPPRTSLPAPAERQSRGRPLDAGTAGRMGDALGHSFADVRIHDDRTAADFVGRQRAINVH